MKEEKETHQAVPKYWYMSLCGVCVFLSSAWILDERYTDRITETKELNESVSLADRC